MTEQEIIQWLYKTGHFFSPEVISSQYRIGFNDLPSLTLDHPAVKAAIRSIQALDANMDNLALKHHNRLAIADGDIGPATAELMTLPRCEVPDHFSPSDARGKPGTGSWPMPCQKTGIKIHIATTGMPSSTVSRWPKIKKQFFEAYNLMGGKLLEVQNKNEANIQMYFGAFFGSTIGLAEFNSQSCSDTVTCKLSSSYSQQDCGLPKHELGHNFNLGHTRGGTMNPSILKEIDPEGRWAVSDPSYSTLVRYLGGEPVDNLPPDFPPPSPPNPIPPSPTPTPVSFWEWLKALLGL